MHEEKIDFVRLHWYADLLLQRADELIFGDKALSMGIQLSEGVDDIELERLSDDALPQSFDDHLLLRDHGEQVLDRGVGAFPIARFAVSTIGLG